LLLSITSSALIACDFFQELESKPGAEGETGAEGPGATEAGETEGTPCDVLDERCSDQDTLHSCNPTTGAIDVHYCTALCGADLINFTCTPMADFRHACWCVSPGTIKLDSCSQLEACIVDCGGDPGSPCSNGCFERTIYQTVRLLGSLYSCADRACDELCAASPGECGSCLLLAKAGLFGDCGLQRSVCDADTNDEPTWP
jgi:hypothetical protein